MQDGRTTLSKVLIDTLDRKPGPQSQSGLSALLIDVAASIKTISAALTKGALGGNYGSAQSVNTHGEEQKVLDLATNDIFLQHCEWDGLLAGMVSEEMEGVYDIPEAYPRGDYLLAFDPLDGSSNIDINGVVGSIFSVLRVNGAWVHAGARCRQLRAYAFRYPHPRRLVRVRDQRIERTLLGATRAPLRAGMQGRQERLPRARLQHALDRVDGGRSASHPDARRRVHVSARLQDPRDAGTPAPAL
jgi:fructose-1,6-bisphosphatase